MSARFFPPPSSRWKSFLSSVTGLGFICVAVLFLVPQSVRAAQVTVAWDPSTSASVSGYKLYLGTASRTYSATYDAGGSTSYVVSGIDGSQSVYLAATAYDSAGNESDYSTELTCQTLVASSAANGSISPAGTTVVANGDSRTFTITPDSGYVVSDVKVDGVSKGAIASYTFSSVSAPHTITATFAVQSFAITASAGSNGSITPSGTTLVGCGASQTYTVTPSAGCKIADVKVDGVSKGAIASYTFSSVSAAHTISATFALQSFAIAASAGSNGSITPSGTTLVDYGASQTYTITPSAGCKIADVKVDGVSKGAIASYTFSSVSAAHTISATFAPILWTISTSVTGSGTITPSGMFTVSQGSSQTFTMVPQNSSGVVDLKVDGVSQGAVSSYTLGNITANHTIVAVFGSPVRIVPDVASISLGDLANRGVNVKLSDKPASTVTVSISWLELDGGETSQAGTVLTFTPGTWSTAQCVKLSSRPDFADGDRNTVLHFSATGLIPGDVTIDAASMQVEPIHVLPASNSTPPQIVVLKADSQNGVNEVSIKGSKSGLAVGTVTFDTTSVPNGLGVASVQGSNSLVELLVDPLGGGASVEIRDANTNAQVNSISLDMQYAPKRLAVLPDLNGDGVSEVAVAGVDASTSAVRVQILDPLAGAVIRNISYAGGRVPKFLAVIPSINA
ncbi:MAG: hypothetical protein LLF99_00490, partial [Desulfobacteraceae bacterium]|nr:hypothetical protein [Desulfobacteraceae bacterium]